MVRTTDTARTVHRPEVAIEEEEDADAQVKGPFNAQIAGADGDDLGGLRAHKEGQKLGGQQTDEGANQQAEHHHPEDGLPNPGPNAVLFSCPVVLGHEGGKGVAKVLDGHVS